MDSVSVLTKHGGLTLMVLPILGPRCERVCNTLLLHWHAMMVSWFNVSYGSQYYFPTCNIYKYILILIYIYVYNMYIYIYINNNTVTSIWFVISKLQSFRTEVRPRFWHGRSESRKGSQWPRSLVFLQSLTSPTVVSYNDAWWNGDVLIPFYPNCDWLIFLDTLSPSYKIYKSQRVIVLVPLSL